MSEAHQYDLDISIFQAVFIFLMVLGLIFVAYRVYSKVKVNTHLDDGAVKFWIHDNYITEAKAYYAKKALSTIVRIGLGMLFLVLFVCLFMEYKEPPIECDNSEWAQKAYCESISSVKRYFVELMPNLIRHIG
jgi:uncharacterized membrane protein YukC